TDPGHGVKEVEQLRPLKRFLVTLVGGGLALACAGSALAATASTPQYEPSTLLVKFKQPSKAAAVAQSLRDEVAGELDGVAVVRLQPGESVTTKAAQYRRRGEVAYAEPNYLTHAAALPNDPRFGDQWALATIHAAAGWDLFPGPFPGLAGPKIAILDTGIDATHPDLAANVGTGANCLAGTSCSAGSTQDDDSQGHGTHVAGLAGAVANNGIGVAGVSFSSQLLPVKVLDATGAGSFAGAAAGIDWAV